MDASPLAASQRAVAIITAYCGSSAHAYSGSKEDDVHGQALLDIVDEMADDIHYAETEEELDQAKNVLFATLTNILGITDSLMDMAEVDPFEMIQNIAQENLRRLTS